MISRINTRRFGIVLVIAMLLTFQNCSSPNEEGAADGSSTGQSYTEKLPFAYTVRPDTIAHMSCSSMRTGFNPRAYFSFKVMSATSAGGIGVTPEFLLATNKFTASQRIDAFADSTLNANTQIQLSIRKTNDYQAVFGAAGGTSRLGYDVDGFLDLELANPTIASHLAMMQIGEVRKYFPGPQEKRLVEGTLRYFDTTYNSNLDVTRGYLADKTMHLVAGYTDTSDILSSPLRGPSGVTTQGIFGSGYMLDFKVPAGFNSADTRALNSVLERDLKTNSTVSGAGWVCDPNFQFMIIRPEDIVAKKIACFTGADRHDKTYPIELERLQKIRRVLRVEDWYVDVKHRCVVPKTPIDFCYGDPTQMGASTALDNINYTASAQTVLGVTYPAGTCGGLRCPQYVTLCTRQ